jgi:hypothetical protein
VSSQPGAVSYRYYLPELTDVEVRTEVGRIPLTYLKDVLASGYHDEITTGIREQVRNARVLLGDEDLGKSLITGFAGLKPKRRLLGEYLHHAREALTRARGSSPVKDRVAFTCAVDEFSRNLWRLVLVSIHRVGVQKDKHEIRAARRELDPRTLEIYRVSRRISKVDRTGAAAVLRAAGKALSQALALVGVDNKILGESEV